MQTNTPLPPSGIAPPSPAVPEGASSSRRRRKNRQNGRPSPESALVASHKSSRDDRPVATASASVLDEDVDDEVESSGPDSLLLGQLESLEAAIAERDQLVTALTVQLEDAAERLDRMQRMGNDRNSPRGGGSLPREFVEEQRAVGENVQRLVEQWDEVQPGSAFGRLEMQLSELRDLIAGNLVASPEQRPASEPTAAENKAISSWEAMKANLLGEPAPQHSPSEERRPTDVSMSDLDVAEEDVALPEPPPAVDLAALTVEQLREAVDHRDQFITSLIRKLRISESRRFSAQAIGASELPEEVQQRLQELEKLVVEQQRLTEVELSLERARLSREEARLKHLEEALIKELKRNGVSLGQAKSDEPPANESPKSRRWRRILGIVRDETE